MMKTNTKTKTSTPTKIKTMRPIQVALFMLCCLAMMAVVCGLMPEQIDVTIRTPQLRTVLDLAEANDTIVTTDTIAPTDTIVPVAIVAPKAPVVKKEPIAPKAPVVTIDTITSIEPQPAISTNTIDTRAFLSTFYQSLAAADSSIVRVVHYGDSQVEEDRLTMQVRRALQKRYGGGGVGIIPLHQTIPTRTLSQHITMNGAEQSINQGPKRYLVYGPKSMHRKDGVYGPMGQVAVMDNTLVSGSEDILMRLNGFGQERNTESYYNRIRILKKGDINVSIERATGQEGMLFTLPDSTTSATIHLEGQGDIYGISLECDHGVMVDNIPMRGCSGIVFTSIASQQMQAYFRATNTRLIILQYGGNVMPFTTTRQQVDQYVANMRTQIQYIKCLAPESSILFVGPSDMSERRDGRWQTYRMIPVMDAALRQMAIEQQIGYFSMYQQMGGNGSMIQWKERGLAGGDYVHFTPRGAEKAGEMLAKWLLKK